MEDETVERELAGTDWRREGETIVRDVKFKSFAEAMASVNRVAGLAEEVNHHPDILVHGWNRVRLTLTTHSAGRLTDNDLQMARRIDGLAES
jgi:4a-hydroxytetrahydrobiopterin dehydratase